MYDLKVEGASDLLNRINRFEPAIKKVLQKSIRTITTEVKDDAESLEPTGKALFGTMGGDQVSEGWGAWTAARDGRDLAFDGTDSGLRGGMKVQVRTTRTAGVQGIVGKVLAPNNPAAAIFLLAGSKNPKRKTGWGGNFNAELNDRYGKNFPRGLTTAWRRGYKSASARIDQAIEAARAAIVG